MESEPGIYEVISKVAIRREPRIVEYIDPKTKKLVTNQVGLLSVGQKRAVYGILTAKDNTTWGRVSFHDSAGIAEWVCIQGINRGYMKFLEPLKDAPAPVDGIAKLEALIVALEKRVKSLEQIAGLVK